MRVYAVRRPVTPPALECPKAGLFYTAPTLLNNESSSPLSSSFTIPPIGPSLQPPTNSPPIQIAGTLVRPSKSPISARIAFPSTSKSSSTTSYSTFLPSRTSFALMQKGHVVKLNIKTPLFSMRSSIRLRTATAS